MDNIEMTTIVKMHLAEFLECGPEVFEKKGLVFQTVGKRAERFQNPFFQVLSCGETIAAAVSPSVLKTAEKLLTGKSRV